MQWPSQSPDLSPLKHVSQLVNTKPSAKTHKQVSADGKHLAEHLKGQNTVSCYVPGF